MPAGTQILLPDVCDHEDPHDCVAAIWTPCQRPDGGPEYHMVRCAPDDNCFICRAFELPDHPPPDWTPDGKT